MERNVLEFVDHLHEHFLNPCSINENGRYNVPTNPDEGYRYEDQSISKLIVNCVTVLRCTKKALRHINGQVALTGDQQIQYKADMQIFKN